MEEDIPMKPQEHPLWSKFQELWDSKGGDESFLETFKCDREILEGIKLDVLWVCFLAGAEAQKEDQEEDADPFSDPLSGL